MVYGEWEFVSTNTFDSILDKIRLILSNGGNQENLMECYKELYTHDPLMAVKFAFFVLDRHHGLGCRDLSKQLFSLHQTDREYYNILKRNLYLFPKYGRFDLLFQFINTSLEDVALTLYANQLIVDRNNILKGGDISLAAKWAPTEGKKYDKNLNATYKLASKIYELNGFPNYVNIDKPNLLKLYRKMYLSYIRPHLNIPERDMCSKRWTLEEGRVVDYKSMSYNHLKKYLFKGNSLWIRKDPEGVKNFIQNEACNYVNSVYNNKKINIKNISTMELKNYVLSDNYKDII